MKFGDFARGVAILAKYQDPDEYAVHVEDDTLMCCSFSLPLTPEDKAEMERMGWFEHEESWSVFT